MLYRRAQTAGGTYFFTVNLADRQADYLTRHIDILRQVMRTVKQNHPFEIVATVILPEHLHAIWQLPAEDQNYATRRALIKAGFSRAIPKTEEIGTSRQSKRERGIWQRRYWEHQIRDDDDLQKHVDYIHFNPAKHDYAQRAIDWPYSSINQYLARGLVTEDWGIDKESFGDFGE